MPREATAPWLPGRTRHDQRAGFAVKLPFWEEAKPSGAILGRARDDVINELCDRKQTVLLATPYLHYESRLLARDGQELMVRATMSRDAVKHALGQHPLRLRFGWALSFYSGPTRILGYVQEENRRYLKIEMPDHLVLDEQRRALRISRVGHSSGALGSEDGTILRVSLENLSTAGAGVFCLESIPAEKFLTGRPLDLSLSLEQGFVLMGSARICHSEGQSLGLTFHPPLSDPNLRRLSEWLAPRAEEARRRWDNRAELWAKAEQQAKPKAAPSGVLLVSTRTDLKAQLVSALEATQPLRSVIPAMAPFKDAQSEPPLLLLIDAKTEGMEGRYRIRTILEALPVNAPVVVLGSSDDPEGGRLLAKELKATTYLEWNPQQGPFFRRLVQGLIQSYWKEEG